MRKIIQLLYDHRSTKPSQHLTFIALCDDGTVWRQIEVEDRQDRVMPMSSVLQIVDPTYHIEWEPAEEFGTIPGTAQQVFHGPDKLLEPDPRLP